VEPEIKTINKRQKQKNYKDWIVALKSGGMEDLL